MCGIDFTCVRMLPSYNLGALMGLGRLEGVGNLYWSLLNSYLCVYSEAPALNSSLPNTFAFNWQ